MDDYSGLIVFFIWLKYFENNLVEIRQIKAPIKKIVINKVLFFNFLESI